MSRLRRLAQAAGRIFMHTAERLLAWGTEKPQKATDFEAALDEAVDDGPPAHWLETVRAKAPWFLTGGRLGGEQDAPRMVMPALESYPEQRPTGQRARAPEDRPLNVIYKERNDQNATSEPRTLSRRGAERPNSAHPVFQSDLRQRAGGIGGSLGGARSHPQCPRRRFRRSQ